jgi:hypothetical protein
MVSLQAGIRNGKLPSLCCACICLHAAQWRRTQSISSRSCEDSFLMVFRLQHTHTAHPVLAAAHAVIPLYGNRRCQDQLLEGGGLRTCSFPLHLQPRRRPEWLDITHAIHPPPAGWHMAACDGLMENEHPTTTVAAGRKPMPNQANKHWYGLRRYPADVHCSCPKRKYYEAARETTERGRSRRMCIHVHVARDRWPKFNSCPCRILQETFRTARSTYVRRTLQLPVRLRR